jgi:hypothetical protein
LEIKISRDALGKKKLMVATPMYGGQCAGMYTRSMIDLGVICHNWGIRLQLYFLFNESLITRARNYCADEFMRSDATHLMFIDSDIGFNPNDVIALLAQMDEDADDGKDIMCGPYPKKCISWEKVLQAANKGFGDDNPNDLERFIGDFVFNPKDGQSILIDEPAQILEGGTGFMMIKRSAFDKVAAKFPELSYRPDHARTADFDGSREIMAYFMDPICPKTKRLLSEDYFFCQKVWEAGGQVWLCPWMELKHVGSYVFAGSLRDLAAVGAHATVDMEQIKKTKSKKRA